MVKIFIDPGHEGVTKGLDPGAVGNGLKEADLTLDIAKRMRGKLSTYNNVQVKLSREGNKKLTLSQRAKMANDWGADIFVSIHINAGGGVGFESFIFNGNVSEATRANQNVIHQEIIRATGWNDRGKKRENYAVLRETKMPAILTENGFIDNTTDANKLKNDSFLDKIAQGHVNGIVKLFNLKKNSTPSGVTHIVQAGDTLWGISQKYGVTIEQIKEANGLTSDTIYIGQKLIIPIGGCYVREFKVGDKVKIKSSATHYATGQNIPSWVKNKTYTIQQVKSDRVLLKEIVSWVYKKDLE
jgi:N-acetylmuramoyl-L-alanine amidase